MKKTICLLLALLLMLPAASITAEEKETTVVATFYPIYVLAENVLEGVEHVNLVSMTAPTTGCLHDYQLLTSDMRSLSKAGALLANGAGMEGFLPDVVSQFPDLLVVDCSEGVELIPEEHPHHDHDHDHGEFNAHIWLSPKNAMQMVKNIGKGLTEILPDQADKINENVESYIARLSEVDQHLAEAISQLPKKDIVPFHEAFPYFARDYGLNIVAVVALEPDEPISPKMLAEVVKMVRDAGNPPLFTEPQYEMAALQAVSAETGAPIFELDPLVTGDGALTAYEDTMMKNLAVLQEALGE